MNVQNTLCLLAFIWPIELLNESSVSKNSLFPTNTRLRISSTNKYLNRFEWNSFEISVSFCLFGSKCVCVYVEKIRFAVFMLRVKAYAVLTMLKELDKRIQNPEKS